MPFLISILMLTACNSSGGSTVENTLDPLQTPGASDTATNEVQDPRAYCPQTVMRAGTETYDIYPDKVKKDDPGAEEKLRFRATISEAVRECNYAGNTLNIRVGVAGKVISGPNGETGAFTLPLRVAVTQGDTVLYSQLHDVGAEIPPGQAYAPFSYVDNGISIPKPESRNIIIYVGFDDLRVDLPNAVPPKKLQPIN